MRQLLGLSLGDMWRDRHWRELLELIDHLPQNCHFSAAVSNDDEHMAMLAEHTKDTDGPDAPWTPPIQTWSPEVNALAAVVDAVRGVERVLVMVNSKKGANVPAAQMWPRPENALARAKVKLREEKYTDLADRILGRNLSPEERGRRLEAQKAYDAANPVAAPDLVK